MAEGRMQRLARLGSLSGRVAGRSIRSRAKGLLRRGADRARAGDIFSEETAEDITQTLPRLVVLVGVSFARA